MSDAIRLVGRDAVAVAVYALLLTLVGSPTAPTVPGESAPLSGAPLALLTAAAVLPCALRRLWPGPVFCWVLAVTWVAVVLDAVRDPFLPAAFALHAVAVGPVGRRWWQRWPPGPAIAVLLCAGLVAPAGRDARYWWSGGPGLIVLGCVALMAAWELGRAARERRAFALRAAEQLAQRAVTEERLRIARELHDVVTHSMGLIVVRAGVANHVVRSRPEEAAGALRDIEATGRSGLLELRQMLGVLRSQGGERLPASHSPAPGPRELAELARRAGAELETAGLDGLPEGVGLAAYRIVQEALTNVLRHAGPGAVGRVAVRAEDGEVRLTVRDDGRPGLSYGPPGHGMVGMRERVALYGGTFTAGPVPGGGFEVRAVLPYAPAGCEEEGTTGDPGTGGR
ncbi:hypothetical protein GCM10010232_14710 [Streptomyces amakusaensis]|uniref:histidine kinase n=1 Tax=Streptomyces amakusaensis TaxID=67271 RepID=A0ABW0ABR6_9ACTN